MLIVAFGNLCFSKSLEEYIGFTWKELTSQEFCGSITLFSCFINDNYCIQKYIRLTVSLEHSH